MRQMNFVLFVYAYSVNMCGFYVADHNNVGLCVFIISTL